VSRALVPALLLLAGCPASEGVGTGTYALMEPDAELQGRRTFFDFPWPSDARKKDDGRIDVDGWPGPDLPELRPFKPVAASRRAFPAIPVGYFHFNGPVAKRETLEAYAPEAESPVLLVELRDGQAPKLLPVIAFTLPADPYTIDNLLAVAPRPGVVLRGGVSHAFVVRRSYGAGDGARLGIPPLLHELAGGKTPAGAKASKLPALYAPLFTALDTLKVPRSEVAAATVFTTSDEVAANAELSQKMRMKYSVDVQLLDVELDPRFDALPFCHLRARVTMPQFQKGTAPFDTEGLFDADGADGLPPKQRDETALVSFAIPKGAMPAAGWPLVVFFHGSGGRARELIDGAEPGDPGIWPAATLTAHGLAVAGQALPLSADRTPGLGDFAYLNFQNPVVMRDTFRQGIIESRLFLDALERLRVPAAALAACPAATLSGGATEGRFDLSRLTVQGQSMGGMYVNLVSAVDPRILACVPTGAGGHWTYFAVTGQRVPLELVGDLLETPAKLQFLHPAFALMVMAWEPMEPLVSTPRLSRRPLEGHPARSVYEPVSQNDSYFTTDIYDALVLGYGNPLAGPEVWPGVTAGLAALGLPQTAEFPVKQNAESENGSRYTAAAVQHANDGGFDGHGIYRRIDSVKRQFGCFHQTFHATGTAVIPPPAPATGPCPQ